MDELKKLIPGILVWFNSRKTKTMLVSLAVALYLYHTGEVTAVQALATVAGLGGLNILGTSLEDAAAKSGKTKDAA